MRNTRSSMEGFAREALERSMSYDAHQSVMLNRVVYGTEDEDTNGSDEAEQFEWQVTVCCDELLFSDSNSIFLVDHAWTFEPGSIRESLEKVPGLKERMASLMDIEGNNPGELIDAIAESVWRFCRHYKVSPFDNPELLRQNPELQYLRWYVLDEVGSRIGHSDEPTARMIPFFYIPRGICYSVFWPLRDLHRDDAITVDYVEHVKDASLRPYYLLPWQPQDHSEDSVNHTYTLTDEFFGLLLIRSHLTDPRFTLTDKPEEAQILWLLEHFKEFA
ncbi:unnamed protein product [Echinostoma caproni]|uniref:Tubulin--tyrosine ligase-like protein 12 n=1 Tax=Echinostoma caproni TaxID=27848 RepID=A0A183AZM6_9TREM|nr:unnamed protein product [Echinostoma caproni]